MDTDEPPTEQSPADVALAGKSSIKPTRMKHDRLNASFQLWKDFRFEAAHQLTKVGEEHPCGRLHGHSYKVRIHCRGKLDPEKEWVVDYADIAAATLPLIEKLDHTLLNDHLDFETTAENLAWWLGETIKPALPSLHAVEVFETPSTSAMIVVGGCEETE